MADDAIPTYKPGDKLTAKCSAAVTGKRCVKISGNRTSGPGLSATAEGGTVQVAHADAGGRIFGVASWTTPSGGFVTIERDPGTIVPIRCTEALDAFEEVEVGANGTVVAKAAGVAIGYAISGAAINTDAEISLY